LVGVSCVELLGSISRELATEFGENIRKSRWIVWEEFALSVEVMFLMALFTVVLSLVPHKGKY